jgi:hypothetical protein
VHRLDRGAAPGRRADPARCGGEARWIGAMHAEPGGLAPGRSGTRLAEVFRMRNHQVIVAAVFALVAGIPACVDPAIQAPATQAPAGEPEAATAAQASLATARVSLTGIIVSAFPVPLGCRALEGTVVIPDVSGQTHGTAVTISDCHWNTSAQLCECTISLTQR